MNTYTRSFGERGEVGLRSWTGMQINIAATPQCFNKYPLATKQGAGEQLLAVDSFELQYVGTRNQSSRY